MTSPTLGGSRSRRRDSYAAGRARLTIRLLGTPLVTVDGAPVAGLVNSKALALLSWLVLEGDRPHLREGLAAKFWRDQPEHLANQNLRQLLTRLRRAIRDSEASPPHILVTAHQVQFDRTSDYWLDVEAFEGLLDQAARHPHRRLEACPSCLKRLGAAIAIYRGALLDGFGLSGGDPSFDEWLAIERERLQMRACAAMHAVANRHLACGRPESAFLVALRLLQQDPWNESAERIVMHALALSDGRNEALAHYRAFRASLLRDLGVEPEDATRRLEAQIRSGRLPVSGLRGSAGTTPLPGTRLVGRQTEIATIRNHLASRDRRLVTIHGPGGSGKTRLALEVAQREAPLWQDGVWFVPLSEVASVEGLTCALASSLDIPSSGREFALGDIIAACGDKEALLVLDSFDQLVSEAEVVSEVLGSAPRLKVVVTSRTRLGRREEWVVEVDGLSVPEEATLTPQAAASFDSVRLFVRAAQQTAPGFDLTPGNVGDVVRICRLVSGLPLGIELAAAWVRVLSCHETAEQIAQSPVSLHEPGDTGGQSRTLRSTLACSYEWLSPEQRAAFRQLSVFRDGFTPEAARAVAGADISVLARLADRSLVRRLRSGRLDLHALLADLAAERLADDQTEQAATLGRHRRHYFALLHDHAAGLSSNDTKAAVAAIEAEYANVRAAWLQAVAACDYGPIGDAVRPLSVYLFLSGRFPEAEDLMGRAAEQVGAVAGDDPAAARLAARLRSEQAEFALRRGRHDEAAQIAAQAIALARAAGDDRCEAEAEFKLAAACRGQGQLESAREHLERALERDRAAAAEQRGGDLTWLERRCLNDLAALCWRQGDLPSAEGYLLQMRGLCVRAGNKSDEAVALGNLGVIAEEQGDYSLAQQRYAESLTLAEAVGRPLGPNYINLGELCLEVGAYDEAEAYLQLALENARVQGVVLREASALCGMSLLAHCRGDNAAALTYAAAALDIARRTGDPSALARAWMSQGRASLHLGQVEEAAEAYGSALELQRLAGGAHRTAPALAGLAAVCLLRGQPDRAVEHVEAIMDHLRTRTLDGSHYRSEVYLMCYQVLTALGDPRAARLLEGAYRELEQRCDKITDDGMRLSFRQCVPANRAIIEAWSDHPELGQIGS